MDIRCFKFMLILTFVDQIQGLPLGCPYNGIHYKEGENVATEEPCLSCVCQKGTLECSLRVCADYSKVPSPACFLVHKPNDCCPQLFCGASTISSRINVESLILNCGLSRAAPNFEVTKSFRVRVPVIPGSVSMVTMSKSSSESTISLEPVDKSHCDEERLRSFGVELRTHLSSNTNAHGTGCVINGSVYAEGSAVASSRVCEYCYCVEGEAKCIKPRCLQFFEDCKAVYEKSSCCPTHYDCRDADDDYLTTQIKNFAKVNPSDFPISLSSASLSSEEIYFNATASTATIFMEAEDITADSVKTTVKEMYTEETTTESEMKSVITSTETWVTTTMGIQTTKTQTLNEESLKITFTEATSEAESETNVSVFSSQSGPSENQKEVPSVQTRSHLEFGEKVESSTGNHNNSSSQDVVDYDSYDYNEPRLPPSLPNLIIFPFVAADAVVKNESTDLPVTFEKKGIEKIDSQSIFYRDRFSPPPKTEGGFVPREPLKSNERFYEYEYFSRVQMEQPTAGSKEHRFSTNLSPLTRAGKCDPDALEVQHRKIFSTSKNCLTCTCQNGAVVCQDVECSVSVTEKIKSDNQKDTAAADGSALEISSKMTSGRIEEVVRTDPETPPNFISKNNTMIFHENPQKKKPVTVTYKNVVVDLYPNYFITTTRDRFKLQSVESAAQKIIDEGFQHPTSTTKRSLLSVPNDAETSISSKTVETTQQTPTEKNEITSLTKKMSLSTEFLQLFSSKDATSETTTATTAMITNVAKHKYSSKFKGQINTTDKDKDEEVREKTKEGIDNTNSTIDLYPLKFNSIMRIEGVTEKTKTYSATRKSVKNDDVILSPKTPSSPIPTSLKPYETKNSKLELPEPMVEVNPSRENFKVLVEKSGKEGIDLNSNAVSLLKLAGCNIYGMMYRVGKIIAELSGPCLECLCAESGVQCRPLKC